MRLLFDPTPTDGGGSPEVPPPKPAETKGPDLHAIVAKLSAEVASLRNEKGERSKADAEANEKKLRDKGDYERLMKERDEEINRIKTELKSTLEKQRRSARDQALSDAFANSGLTLHKGAADQLRKLWADEFEAVEEDGQIQVRTKDFKSPSDVVKARLASEDYQHFVAASPRGQTRPGGGSASATPSGGEKPATLFDQFTQLYGPRAKPGGMAGGFGFGFGK